jgi:hypothetical protein
VFALALVGLRLIIIWVVNNTKNSVFMATLVHASAALIRLFHSPIVLGSYLNLARAACALALALIAATRGRIGYREEVDTVFDETAAVR